jgi:hypothetical protein
MVAARWIAYAQRGLTRSKYYSKSTTDCSDQYHIKLQEISRYRAPRGTREVLLLAPKTQDVRFIGGEKDKGHQGINCLASTGIGVGSRFAIWTPV